MGPLALAGPQDRGAGWCIRRVKLTDSGDRTVNRTLGTGELKYFAAACVAAGGLVKSLVLCPFVSTWWSWIRLVSSSGRVCFVLGTGGPERF